MCLYFQEINSLWIRIKQLSRACKTFFIAVEHYFQSVPNMEFAKNVFGIDFVSDLKSDLIRRQ